jgi:hypothetical protein
VNFDLIQLIVVLLVIVALVYGLGLVLGRGASCDRPQQHEPPGEAHAGLLDLTDVYLASGPVD